MASRPYRIWDSEQRRFLRWRCYGILRNAQNGALIEVRWAAISLTYEVIDMRTGAHHGTYHRRLSDIAFYPAGNNTWSTYDHEATQQGNKGRAGKAQGGNGSTPKHKGRMAQGTRRRNKPTAGARARRATNTRQHTAA